MLDLEFITDNHSKNLIANACETINRLNLWDYMKSFEPGKGGYTYSLDPVIKVIGKEMENSSNPPGHSGFSFGWTMRAIEHIAKHGIESYKKEYLNHTN